MAGVGCCRASGAGPLDLGLDFVVRENGSHKSHRETRQIGTVQTLPTASGSMGPGRLLVRFGQRVGAQLRAGCQAPSFLVCQQPL